LAAAQCREGILTGVSRLPALLTTQQAPARAGALLPAHRSLHVGQRHPCLKRADDRARVLIAGLLRVHPAPRLSRVLAHLPLLRACALLCGPEGPYPLVIHLTPCVAPGHERRPALLRAIMSAATSVP